MSVWQRSLADPKRTSSALPAFIGRPGFANMDLPGAPRADQSEINGLRHPWPQQCAHV